jgi:hypothetical protein
MGTDRRDFGATEKSEAGRRYASFTVDRLSCSRLKAIVY